MDKSFQLLHPVHNEEGAEILKQENAGRGFCRACRNPPASCFCFYVRAFDPKIRFIILTHKLEARRRIASGRLSHLSLTGSELWMGHDFSDNARVNRAIANPAYHSALLYPGESSVNLSRLSDSERSALAEKPLQVFVLDGTWATARQSMRLSANLRALPRFSFDVEGESRFRIREQPRKECFSSLEAIHKTIELLGPGAGFDTSTREHDSLLVAFDRMIARQLELVNPTHWSYSRPGFR